MADNHTTSLVPVLGAITIAVLGVALLFTGSSLLGGTLLVLSLAVGVGMSDLTGETGRKVGLATGGAVAVVFAVASYTSMQRIAPVAYLLSLVGVLLFALRADGYDPRVLWATAILSIAFGTYVIVSGILVFEIGALVLALGAVTGVVNVIVTSRRG